MKKITMSKQSNLTVEGAFELFIRKCKVRNLTENTITFYNDKIRQFYRFCSANTLINETTIGTLDEYVLWMRENTEIKDVTINSYLRAVRSFMYYCMECNFLKRFKIELIKAEKKIKETYTDEELQRLLEKPDVDNCSFSTYRCWIFENYLLGTGNRISTVLDIKIGDIHFKDGLINLRKTKNRKQQIIPLSNTLADILSEYLDIRKECIYRYI